MRSHDGVMLKSSLENVVYLLIDIKTEATARPTAAVRKTGFSARTSLRMLLAVRTIVSMHET